MNSRRLANARAANLCGVPTPRIPSGDHEPSKTDLFKVLDSLKFKRMPEENAAEDVFNAATKARKRFERHNKTWMQLRKAEQAAGRELRRIAPLARERRDNEIAECRTMLRLHGVTPALIARIELLVYGNDDISGE